MVFLGGSGGEAFEVEVLGFEGVGWGGGFDFGDELEDLESVHVVSQPSVKIYLYPLDILQHLLLQNLKFFISFTPTLQFFIFLQPIIEQFF